MICTRNIQSGIRIATRKGLLRVHFSAATLLVLASVIISSVAFAGQLDKVVTFDIKAQTLGKALLQFAAQAHVQISFASNSSTASLRTPELKGSYTGEEALA